NLGQLNDSLETIVTGRAANSLVMTDLKADMEAMGSRARALILTDDPTTMTTITERLRERYTAAAAGIEKLKGNLSDPRNIAALEQFTVKFDSYVEAVKEAQEPALINSDLQALGISRSEGSAALGKVEETMGALKKTLASRVAGGDLA